MSELVVTPFGMYGNSGDACYVKVNGQGRLSTEQKLEIESRVNNHDALTEHLRFKEEECKQLQHDKAELEESISYYKDKIKDLEFMIENGLGWEDMKGGNIEDVM